MKKLHKILPQQTPLRDIGAAMLALKSYNKKDRIKVTWIYNGRTNMEIFKNSHKEICEKLTQLAENPQLRVADVTA